MMRYKGLTGAVIVPGDAAYERNRREWNLAIDEYPLAIVYCFDEHDVANAIRWAERYGVPIRIRAGGHNYEGYSIGTGALVIDVSFLNSVQVNCEKNIARVGAGTRLLNLYQALYTLGYTFPGGTCPTVAISGLVLGGGIGLSTRYLGLTADSLVSAEMVDASGRLLTASCQSNRDLFWALRGAGGGNFGVVTSYQFTLRPVDKITLIQLAWNNNKPARLEFLSVWQNWLINLDRRISAFGGIYKLGAWMNSFFYGRPEEAEQVLEPLLQIPGLTLRRIEYVDFIDAVATIGKQYPAGEAFQSPGRFVHRLYSPEELLSLIRIADAAPSDSADSTIKVYSLGGAVRDMNPDSTAFFYRQADYILAISSSWEDKEDETIHKQWVAEGFRYIYSITVGSYINFPYSVLPDYQQAYFGGEVSGLQYVKQRYDPRNVFHFPQSIEPLFYW